MYFSYIKREEIRKKHGHNLKIIPIYQHPLKYRARPETFVNVQILFSSAEHRDIKLLYSTQSAATCASSQIHKHVEVQEGREG